MCRLTHRYRQQAGAYNGIPIHNCDPLLTTSV
jgi:hypothetical protein